MTADDVKRFVNEIEILAHDDEAAHAAEDRLHVAVLRIIAEGKTEDPVGLAREALATVDIEFSRWYA